MKRFFAYFLIFCMTVASIAIPWRSSAQPASTLNTSIPASISDGFMTPEWDSFSLRDFGGALEGGTIEAPEEITSVIGRDLSRSWSAGDSISDIYKVGDLSETGIQGLNLRQINELSGSDVKDIAIGEFKIATNQTISELVDEVPGLSDLELGAAQPIVSLVDNALKDKAKKFLTEKATEHLDKLFGKESPLGDLKLGDLPVEDLTNLSVESLPGLADTALEKFAGIEDGVLSQIPGLDQVPIGILFGGLPAFMPLANVDVIWGASETDSVDHVISGSKPTKWAAPCQGQPCQYIELSEYGYDGERWVIGGKDKENGEQMVKGGSGLLGKLLGGKEPTGRPLGKYLKIVLMDTNEAEGTVDIGLAAGFCDGIWGCTPIGFGPWKVGTVSENSLIFMGIPEGKAEELEDIPIPDDIKEQMDRAKDAAGIKPVGGSVNAGKNAREAISKECLLKLVKAVPTELASTAELLVPNLMKQSQDLKLNSSQAAYALAYGLSNSDDVIAAPTFETKYGHRKTLIASRDGLVSLKGAARTEYLQPQAADDAQAMITAAYNDGITLKIGDSHRYLKDQESLFNQQIEKQGDIQTAAKWSAPPGYSEHHTGWAWDVADRDGKLIQPGSQEAQWVKQNSGKHNFQVSFPEGNSQGVAYEPWHLLHTSSAAQQAAGKLGGASSASSSLAEIAPKIEKYVSDKSVDYRGLSDELDAGDTVANIASNLQGPLKDCYAGGSCSPTGRMINPLPGSVTTSEFGMRHSPTLGYLTLHAGIDLAKGRGSTIVAPDCGKVENTSEGGYGNVVIMDHGNGIVTRHAHVDNFFAPNGANVQQHQPIADEGATGRITGPHEHFEIRLGDRWGEPINPRQKVSLPPLV